ncbi:MAG: hypothetical protein HYX26_08360 [Acidobacteriales bacterium]|nr:hypothetical protein [Terriglobales bacterium]
MDALHIWKNMGDARRLQAATAFYSDPALADYHRAADTFLARLKNFRPQFIRKLPAEKRASYLATAPLGLELAAQLIVSYHFAHQRAMMAAFLTGMNIPNDQGLISEDADLSPPSADAIAAAVTSLRAAFPAEDVEIYLQTLLSQNPDTWSGLSALLRH